MRFFKYLLFVIFVPVLFFGLFLAYMTATDYAPAAKSTLPLPKGGPSVVNVCDTLSLLTWNIGYAGLDAGMDFFYDGGTQVRPSQEQCLRNLSAIAGYLSVHPAHFTFIQEIDVEAKRSYYRNQVDSLAATLGQPALFAHNYRVSWVPIPVTEPMGYVRSGVALFSKFLPVEATRHAYPVNFSWPLRVFMLDRCFLVARYPVSDGKQLVVVNTHNSAFDGDGSLRKAELDYLRDFLLQEYALGHYVVVGGDFNQCPAGFTPNPQDALFDVEDDFHTIPSSLLPAGWRYAYGAQPTNRRVVAPYNPATTLHTVIDFFILSPNLRSLGVDVDDLHFQNSDHNPVRARVVME